MKSKAIQETLAKVLEIDQASVDMEVSIDALKGIKEKELRKKEREVELRHMKEARKTAKDAFDRVMEDAKVQESDIYEEGESVDRRMNRLYEKNEQALVQEAMVRIFGDSFVSQKE
jgi:hypothetical protein